MKYKRRGIGHSLRDKCGHRIESIYADRFAFLIDLIIFNRVCTDQNLEISVSHSYSALYTLLSLWYVAPGISS